MELLLIWLGCAVVSGIVASNKGRSGLGWFLLGCLFGFFALILIALIPSRKADPYAPSPSTHVRCSECREFVMMDARKCKHCGCALIPTEPEPTVGEHIMHIFDRVYDKAQERKERGAK